MTSSIVALQEFQEALIETLEPYLSKTPPVIEQDSERPYICLKIASGAFTTTNIPKDLSEGCEVWHIHISPDQYESELNELIRWLQPALVKSLTPAIFRWKLEGGV